MKKLIVATLVLVFAFSGFAQSADQALLTWDNPQTRTDGTAFDPTKEISAFRIYYGVTNPPTTTMTIPVSASFPAKTTGQSYTVTGLSMATTYYFQLSVIDQYSQESDKTAVKSKTTANPTKPGGCANFTVQ